MNINLAVQETLVWHDGPQLFVAKDPVGGLYVCLAVGSVGEMPEFVAVSVSVLRLRALKTGQIDLHSVFSWPEMNAWFQIVSFDEKNAIAEPMPELKNLPKNWLPVSGEFLHSEKPGEASPLRPESFEAVKIGAVAKEAGINASLLRQYLSGVKRPSVEQVRRVEDALHRVGQRLMDVRFL